MARGLRSNLTGSVPISIACHLVALLLLLIIPLTAEVTLPTPAIDLPEYVRVAPMPPPPEVVLRSGARPPTVARSGANLPVPVTAPDSIRTDAAPPSLGPIAGLPDTTGGLADDSIGILTPIPPVPAAPPSVKQPVAVRVADLPIAPRKTLDVRPIYPDLARAARIDGTVVMEAVLDPSGRVTQLRVIQSVPMLDQAAIDAVRQWRYSPSSYGGHPVSVLMTITIRFTLQ